MRIEDSNKIDVLGVVASRKKRSYGKSHYFFRSSQLQSQAGGDFICNLKSMKNVLRILFVLLAAFAIIFIVSARSPHDASIAESNNTNQQAPQTVGVTTTINNGSAEASYNQTVASGSSALEVLLLVGEEQGIDISTTEYDFGSIVDSISGVGVDTTDNKYWIYYINGETATEGASSYLVQDSDTILWNYEDAM
ncbi:MAG: hypothetical protein COT25_02790 [Candidatus Kerfeldbacteria bacterium CG08_land_8_20_14_0_20_42_7]|uniref:Transcobalamin-like C-terminal domain-containing protein n=1 Tax=Candidatus Kerfeldbacteria bacterium CG08_land_8_20_14_0_20_42_7 TaxID=2014245 RepID=A0A2H0YSU0_9BACT|nr:MAG: hypothetical protein COT25_02790 [Candidatus Kerfeldbacteria bacterium CG08_land_8_20_14_0_20_42_7]